MREDGVEGDGVYCGATGAALFALSLRGTRDGRGARRTPFYGKLKSPPAFRFRSRFSELKREACLPASRASACARIYCTRGDRISRKLNDDDSDD